MVAVKISKVQYLMITMHRLRYADLILLSGYCYGQDSTPGCQRQSTVQSFENFVQQESACMVTSGASTFSVLMGNAPVLSALYNDEDVFNAAGLSIPAVNDFCQ